MAAYFLLDTAISDLEGIWRFYDRLVGESLADQRIADLHHRFELIAEYPRIGRFRPELGDQVRSFVTHNPSYTIFYILMADYVEIAHVLHGNEDVGRRFDRPV